MSGKNNFFLFHSGETWGARGIFGHFWPAYTSWFPSSWRSLCLPWVPSVLLCPRIAQAGEDYPKIRNVIQTLTGRWRRGWTMLLPRSRSPLPVCSTRLVKIATHEKLWIRESSSLFMIPQTKQVRNVCTLWCAVTPTFHRDAIESLPQVTIFLRFQLKDFFYYQHRWQP